MIEPAAVFDHDDYEDLLVNQLPPHHEDLAEWHDDRPGFDPWADDDYEWVEL